MDSAPLGNLGRVTSRKRNSKWRFPSQKTLQEANKYKKSVSVQNEKKEEEEFDDQREHTSLIPDDNSKSQFFDFIILSIVYCSLLF